MSFSDDFRRDENGLAQLRVRNKSGQLVPLSAFSRVERVRVNSSVNRAPFSA